MEKKAIVTVERDQAIGEISENLLGSFLEHIGRAIYTGIYEPEHSLADADGFRTDVLELVKELQVPLVRYPGGNFVSGYRWQDGIGPKELRPKRLELAWQSIETNQVGIDDFAVWAGKAGCQVMPAVNMGTAQPQEAADLVEYCNFPGGTTLSDMRGKNGSKDPYGFKYWCIGNEMDGDWQMCHMTSQEYGRKAHETIKMMKWIDSTIKVTVAGSSGVAMPTYPEWDRVVLEHTYEEADYLSLHQYYGFLAGRDQVKDYLHAYLNLDDFIRSIIAATDYVKALKRSKKTMMLSLDEWNIWHNHIPNPPESRWREAPALLENSYDVKDALLFSGLMMTMINHADRIKIGCLAQLVNVIAPILTAPGGGVIKQTTYYPYLMGCRYARGTALRAEVRGECEETIYGDALPVYSAVAYREDTKELAVFLLNPDPESVELTLKLRQFENLQQIEHFRFGAENLETRNTFADPEAAVMKRVDGERAYQKDDTVLLEGYSFHVIRYRETA